MKKILFGLMIFSSTVTFAGERHPIFQTLQASLGEEIEYFSENNFFESKEEEAKVKRLYSELAASLVFIEKVKLSATSPLYREFFPKGPLNFLSENIKEFEWDNLLGTESSPIAMASGPSSSASMSVGFNFLKPHFSVVEKASIIIHEARHNVSSEYDHVDCPKSFPYSSSSGVRLAGLSACEDVYNGSYGTQIVYLNNIARYCLNCDASLKQMAKNLAEDYLKRITNKSAQNKLRLD